MDKDANNVRHEVSTAVTEVAPLTNHPTSNGKPAKTDQQVGSDEDDSEKDAERADSDLPPAPNLGIYWRNPGTMILTFLLGAGFATTQHCFYSHLDGKRVGNATEQQNALRLGTLLAYLAQVSLVGSVHFAYTQNLWRALKRKRVTVSAVNAGFDLTNSLLSFLNREMLWKLRIASFIAFVSWCVPISTVITPATLNENVVLRSVSQSMDVPKLVISDSKYFREFAYTVNATGGLLQKFLGPRTVVTRFARAAANTGQVLQLPTPATNATYHQDFEGPLVRCRDADSAVAAQVDAVYEKHKDDLDPSIREVSNDYFAFVPTLTNSIAAELRAEAADLDASDGALHASNQLWLRFSRPTDLTSNLDVTTDDAKHYMICELYNASYNVDFSWANGKQSVKQLETKILNVVEYPINVTYSTYDEQRIAYSAVFQALSKQLTGYLSFFQDVSTANDSAADVNANRTYSRLSTGLEQSILLGSSDLNNFFRKNHALGSDGQPAEPFSPQRVYDMDVARNRSLNDLIEGLSFNTTISLLCNIRFAPLTPFNVTTTSPEQVYIYRSRNVLITYGIALPFAFIAVCFGLASYRINNVSHDNSFFSIVGATMGIHLSNINAHEKLGALPLDPAIAKQILVFNAPPDERGNRRGSASNWGFGAVRGS